MILVVDLACFQWDLKSEGLILIITIIIISLLHQHFMATMACLSLLAYPTVKTCHYQDPNTIYSHQGRTSNLIISAELKPHNIILIRALPTKALTFKAGKGLLPNCCQIS